MDRITTEDYELLGFFEVEPILREPEFDWLDTELTYEVSRSGLDLRFTVHPSYRDVKIAISTQGNIIYDLFAMGVGNVTITSTEKTEYLTVLLEGEHSIQLYLKPSIRVKQYIEVET